MTRFPLYWLRDFWNDTHGAASLEFSVVFPFLMYIVLSIGETGVMMVRTMMLDRGLSVAIRDLRLGLTENPDHESIKQQICDAAFLLGACEDVLRLELTPVANAWSMPSGPADCVDRTAEVQPAVKFTPGERSQIMFVRACLMVDPIFPGTGLGAMLPVDRSGAYAIIVQSAFMNEPS